MELKSKVMNLTKWLEKYKYLVLVVVLGVILMLLPEKSENESTIPAAPVEEIHETSVSQQLEQILMQVHGAGKVEVMLTLASGEQTIYQTDDSITDSGSGRQDTVIVSDQNREENGLIQQVNAAQYRGAIVVCQGADSAAVRLAIIDAVSKVTGLDSSRISVLKMK